LARSYFPFPQKTFKLQIDDEEYTTSVRNLRSGCTAIAKTFNAAGRRITRADLCSKHMLRKGQIVSIEIIYRDRLYRLTKSRMQARCKSPESNAPVAKHLKPVVTSDDELIDEYVSCLREILKKGWGHEVKENREHPPIETVDTVRFFREYAFCVFAAFFRWRIINKKWQDLTRAFKSWDFEEICRYKQEVKEQAMGILGNERKIKSILECAEKLRKVGWDKFRASLLQASLPVQLELLDDLPGIGRAAKYQLAGAIGIDVAKPDRYLLSFAAKHRYPATEKGVQELTGRISNLVGERVKVVDYVLWRYSEGSSCETKAGTV